MSGCNPSKGNHLGHIKFPETAGQVILMQRKRARERERAIAREREGTKKNIYNAEIRGVYRV
jgi:hypothetical protein